MSALAIVKRAAEIQGRSVSDFVAATAQEAAHRTIAETEIGAAIPPGAMDVMATERDMTLQAILGEAIDLWLREQGKHPFGER